MRKTIALLTVAGIFLVNGCYYDKEELLYPDYTNCSTLNASYLNNVKPIIETRCAVSGCHDAGSVNGPGPLTSYELVKNAAVEIKSAVVSGFMPQNSTLNATEKKAISCWVDSGAPNN